MHAHTHTDTYKSSGVRKEDLRLGNRALRLVVTNDISKN